MNNVEISNETVLRVQKGLYIELAAMFKEHLTGGNKLREKIIAKFCLQEGISKKKADIYYQLLKDAEVITYINGHQSWKYNSKAEWELFHVEI